MTQLRWNLALGRTATFVDGELRKVPDGSASRVVVIGEGITAAQRLAAGNLLAELAIPEDAKVQVQLVLVDSSRVSAPYSWRGSDFALLPGVSGSTGCTVVRVLGPGDSVARTNVEGPCWYLAAFGMPGGAVRAWLDSRYWEAARVIPLERPSVLGWESRPEGQDLLQRIGGSTSGPFLEGSVTLQRCATGKAEACAAALLRPLPPNIVPGGIVPREAFFVYRGLLGEALPEFPPRSFSGLLALMLQDLGTARFAAFWTSDRPVDEAFQAAAGASLGEWYGARIRRELTGRQLGDPRQVAFWPTSAAFALLALVLAILRVRRRQLG